MLHTRISQTFLSLLRAGLWDRHVDDLSTFPLSSQDWEEVYEVSIRHTVESIVFDGIQLLPEQYLPDRKLHIRWLVRVEKIAQRNLWMNTCIVNQYIHFQEMGLDPILLKGQALAQYYVNPLRRICGDVDWYFEDKKQFSAAVAIIRAKGIEVIPTAGRSACYMEKGCDVDLHAQLYDIHNPFAKHKLSEFTKKEVSNRETILIDGVSISLISPLEQSLLVNAHILKHLLSFGIGLRQICDAARLYHHFRGQWDIEAMDNLYSQLNIQKWVTKLHTVLVAYIGLPEGSLPYKSKEEPAEWMLNDILQAGNFGFYDQRYGQTDSAQGGRRSQTKKRIWSNCKKYAPYAPYEAMFFPITHLYTKITR